MVKLIGKIHWWSSPAEGTPLPSPPPYLANAWAITFSYPAIFIFSKRHFCRFSRFSRSPFAAFPKLARLVPEAKSPIGKGGDSSLLNVRWKGDPPPCPTTPPPRRWTWDKWICGLNSVDLHKAYTSHCETDTSINFHTERMTKRIDIDKAIMWTTLRLVQSGILGNHVEQMRHHKRCVWFATHHRLC